MICAMERAIVRPAFDEIDGQYLALAHEVLDEVSRQIHFAYRAERASRRACFDCDA